MTERLTVIIGPPKSAKTQGRIQEVFAQIVDLFDMAGHSKSDDENIVIWRFVSANTQSPLTVVAEAKSARPGVDVNEIAKRQKKEFIKNLEDLRKGNLPDVWQQPNIRKIAERVISRSRNGVGSIRVRVEKDEFRDAAEVILEDSMLVLAEPIEPIEHHRREKPKTQIGAIEGTLIEVGNYYNKPAVKLRERKSGAEIWCVIPDAIENEISQIANFYDVWHGQRVILRGQIEYESIGVISKITVSQVQRVESSTVNLKDIQDEDFTDGLSVLEYLEKFREGELG